jgi:hypothetical protein
MHLAALFYAEKYIKNLSGIQKDHSTIAIGIKKIVKCILTGEGQQTQKDCERNAEGYVCIVAGRDQLQ